jgi:hypothetical protein
MRTALQRSLLLGIATALVCVASHADDGSAFQSEISAALSRASDNADADEMTAIVGFERFIDKVETRGHPFAEAAFLEQAGGFRVDLYDTEGEVDGANGHEFGVGAAMRYASKSQPAVISVRYATFNAKIDSTRERLSTSIVGVGAGLYVKHGVYVGVVYSQTDLTLSESVYEVLGKVTLTTVGVEAKSVLLPDVGHPVVISASVAHTDSDADDASGASVLSLAADFYATRVTSFGAEIVAASGNASGDSRLLALTARSFVTPTLAVSLRFERSSEDDASGADGSTRQAVAAGLNRRF